MKSALKFTCRLLGAASGMMTAAVAFTVTAFAEGEAASGSAAGTAQQASTAQLLTSIVPFILALVLLYLLLLRPQQKREKEAQKMRENVRVGDEICTAGGLVGIVIRITEATIVLETGGERSKIRVKKWAIHENITQMEEAAQLEKERKAARRNGIATAPAAEGDDKKKKKNADE